MENLEPRPPLPQGMQPTQQVRYTYIHIRCQWATVLSPDLARTIAIDPTYYQRVPCKHCNELLFIGNFIWPEDKQPVNKPINRLI